MNFHYRHSRYEKNDKYKNVCNCSIATQVADNVASPPVELTQRVTNAIIG